MNGKLLLGLLESDAIVDEGPAVINFIRNVGSAAGDPFKIVAAWTGLQGDVVALLPHLEADISSQLAGALTTQLQNAVAKAQATIAAAQTAAATPAAKA